MSISFLRVDDRVIHGLITTKWSKELPCDGIIVVNDKIAYNPILKATYVGATNYPTYVWTMEEWKEKNHKVLESKKKYFLITKEPILMSEILIDNHLDSGLDQVVIGPVNEREGTTKIGKNQYLTREEAEAIEKMHQGGYKIWFALIREDSEGYWDKYRSLFGFR